MSALTEDELIAKCVHAVLGDDFTRAEYAATWNRFRRALHGGAAEGDERVTGDQLQPEWRPWSADEDGADFERRTRLMGTVQLPPEAAEGVWVVAGQVWGYEGPYQVTPYPSEVEALRAANADDMLRAYFVPFGTDLREVMR